jgi:hypothetical protein
MSDIVGTVVDRVQLAVERGKIAEFARATRAQDRRHVEVGAASADGYAAPLATATHVVATGHLRDQRGYVASLGLDIERIVVGSVTWSYERALVAGDELTATRRVVADQTRAGRSGRNRLVTLETEFVDATGVVAVRQREVLVERGVR